MSLTVAIDGPAAAGKGTIARSVAARFGFAHLDTGLLYRAVGLRTLRGEEAVAAAASLSRADLADDAALRAPDVAQAASQVAALPEVRAALVDYQRAFARRLGGAVLDGRDIGTVICPDAEVKLFVTATDAVRADRRHRELVGKGHRVSLEEVALDLARRDARDAARATAPMTPARDALLIDTSTMTIEQAIAAATAQVDRALARRAQSSAVAGR